jgi:hypothetical protein
VGSRDSVQRLDYLRAPRTVPLSRLCRSLAPFRFGL